MGAKVLFRKAVQERNQTMNILAIGAHPDDCEIHAGGTLFKYFQGQCGVYTLVLSQATKARKAEAEAAMQILSLPMPLYANLSKKQMCDLRQVVKMIEAAVDEAMPDIVFTHHYADSHQDHRAAYYATLAACREKTITTLLYEPNYSGGHTAATFRPQWFETLSEFHIEMKVKAIACHESQKPGRWLDRVKAASVYWGPEACSKYAEAFEVVKVMPREMRVYG